jgi:hypothetical protein
LVAATGLIIGGIFPSDPITTDPEALSPSGKMHGVGGMLGIPVMGCWSSSAGIQCSFGRKREKNERSNN